MYMLLSLAVVLTTVYPLAFFKSVLNSLTVVISELIKNMYSGTQIIKKSTHYFLMIIES